MLDVLCAILTHTGYLAWFEFLMLLLLGGGVCLCSLGLIACLMQTEACQLISLVAIHLLLEVLSAVCAYMQSLPLSMTVCWINVQCTKLPPSGC